MSIFDQIKLADHQRRFKCHKCGKPSEGPYREPIYHTIRGAMGDGPSDYLAGHEPNWNIPTGLHRCKNGHWACDEHWHSETQSCTSCVPSWVRRVEEEERREQDRKHAEYQAKAAKEAEAKRNAELARQEEELRKQREIEVARRCHVCGKPGSHAAEKCSRCGGWTCRDDIYRGICKSCAERIRI